jgi:ATP adenylyltransferase
MEKLWAPWRMKYILDSKESSDQCIFCELPLQKNDEQNYIVFRSKLSFVMLNKFPYNNGHIMVIPYKHESDYTELDQDILADIQQLIQKSLIALKNCMEPHGYNVGLNLGRTAGAGIDAHLHYHIVPRWSGDTNFMPVISDTKVISESLEESWQKLSLEFEKL